MLEKGCYVPTCCFLIVCFQVPTDVFHIRVDCKWINRMNVVWNTKKSKHWDLLLKSQQVFLSVVNIQRRNLLMIK